MFDLIYCVVECRKQIAESLRNTKTKSSENGRWQGSFAHQEVRLYSDSALNSFHYPRYSVYRTCAGVVEILLGVVRSYESR